MMIRSLLLLLLLLLLQASVAAATNTAYVSPLHQAQYSFADTLTSELYANHDESSSSSQGEEDANSSDNECTSSLGVSMALSLVYPASFGVAREQFEQVMGYHHDQTSTGTATNYKLAWEETSALLTSIYKGECPFAKGEDKGDIFAEACAMAQEPIIQIANSVWIRDDVTLNATYTDSIGNLLQTLDFTDASAGDTINAWASETTNGLIEAIVPSGSFPDSWVLLALNSIYLKASWRKTFRYYRTNQDIFYTNALRVQETSLPAHFMHQVEHFPYSKTAVPGFQIVQLPFAGSDAQANLSMLLALPHQVTAAGLPAQGPVLQEQLVDALGDLQNTRVAIALPKFNMEQTYDERLKSSLEAIGLEAPFQENSLCIVDGVCNAFVDSIIQKTFIDVNEDGVTAAASTAVSVSVTSLAMGQPELMLLDHPFQFFIYDNNTQVILFEGRVENPGIPAGSPDPVLKAKHSDDDFWTSNFNVAEPSQADLFVIVDAITEMENEPGVKSSTVSSMSRKALGLSPGSLAMMMMIMTSTVGLFLL